MYFAASQLPVFLKSLDWHAISEHAIYSGGGFLVALIGAYLILARDVAYIKGRLDLMTDNHKEVEQLRVDVASIMKEIEIEHRSASSGVALSRH